MSTRDDTIDQRSLSKQPIYLKHPQRRWKHELERDLALRLHDYFSLPMPILRVQVQHKDASIPYLDWSLPSPTLDSGDKPLWIATEVLGYEVRTTRVDFQATEERWGICREFSCGRRFQFLSARRGITGRVYEGTWLECARSWRKDNPEGWLRGRHASFCWRGSVHLSRRLA